ncbi:MAG: ribose-5-phosphate isomerase [Actinomycetes bacterium]
MTKYRIAVGSDFAGFELKTILKNYLEKDNRVEKVIDLGVNSLDDKTDYPNIGFALASKIANGEADRGLLVCGTGIGMAISANKVPGIRATTVHDPYSLERAVLSNNCQVITMGARVIASELALNLIKPWLDYKFDEQSSSAPKVKRINELEEQQKG